MTNPTTDRLAEAHRQMATFQDGNAQPHTIALINELADIARSQQAEIEQLREALLDARAFIDGDSPDWRYAKQDQLAAIDAALNPTEGTRE